MEILCRECDPSRPPGDNSINPARHHPGQCREVETPWVITETWGVGPYDEPDQWDYDFDRYADAGRVTEAAVYGPSGLTFPEDTPGFVRHDDQWIEAIVVIVREEGTPELEDADSGPWDAGEKVWIKTYRVRPATAAEGAGYLASE